MVLRTLHGRGRRRPTVARSANHVDRRLDVVRPIRGGLRVSLIGSLVAVAVGAQLAVAAPSVQVLQNDSGWRPQWALDRVDQRGAVLDDRYHYDRTGRGVSVYVFDSGINSAHEDLAGRIDLGSTWCSATTEPKTAAGTEPTAPVSSEAPHTASPKKLG